MERRERNISPYKCNSPSNHVLFTKFYIRVPVISPCNLPAHVNYLGLNQSFREKHAADSAGPMLSINCQNYREPNRRRPR